MLEANPTAVELIEVDLLSDEIAAGHGRLVLSAERARLVTSGTLLLRPKLGDGCRRRHSEAPTMLELELQLLFRTGDG